MIRAILRHNDRMYRRFDCEAKVIIISHFIVNLRLPVMRKRTRIAESGAIALDYDLYAGFR
jgi:hypothetical protein